MTLDEAIEHAEWCARESQGECSGEHMQLGEWLRELRRLRTQSKWLRKEYTSLRKTREREFAASCGAATNSMGQIGTLRDKNAELCDENEKLRELVSHLMYVKPAEVTAIVYNGKLLRFDEMLAEVGMRFEVES
jgi:hypothetical protein